MKLFSLGSVRNHPFYRKSQQTFKVPTDTDASDDDKFVVPDDDDDDTVSNLYSSNPSPTPSTMPGSPEALEDPEEHETVDQPNDAAADDPVDDGEDSDTLDLHQPVPPDDLPAGPSGQHLQPAGQEGPAPRPTSVLRNARGPYSALASTIQALAGRDWDERFRTVLDNEYRVALSMADTDEDSRASTPERPTAASWRPQVITRPDNIIRPRNIPVQQPFHQYQSVLDQQQLQQRSAQDVQQRVQLLDAALQAALQAGQQQQGGDAPQGNGGDNKSHRRSTAAERRAARKRRVQTRLQELLEHQLLQQQRPDGEEEPQ